MRTDFLLVAQFQRIARNENINYTQVAIEEDLKDSREVSFQAALLYTSSKGERRIRVHTLCLPTTASINDVINGADEMAIVGMLTKFGKKRLRGAGLAQKYIDHFRHPSTCHQLKGNRGCWTSKLAIHANPQNVAYFLFCITVNPIRHNILLNISSLFTFFKKGERSLIFYRLEITLISKLV